ncbi:MAG TPA: aspartyl protease family protein [Sphingomonas sp.]|uniref:aspartyl protease family protein n=1 Tax=Sphingomonas sp. TaxID=28214 RepID=UPI002CC62317|nr:aspartyl protease family protein [Sphingomonas sp.]HMI18815.1 aspartyl protease family protein [Sphingomonas sp.]
MRRRDLLIGSIGMLTLATAARSEPPVAFEGPSSVTIPLKRAADDKLYLTVLVMGRDLVMFLDTGASTVLDINIVRTLGVTLADTGQQGFGLTGAAGKRIATHVDMQLGALSITGLPVDCLDLTQLKAVSRGNGMPEFDGVIGAELLTMLQAQVDFGRLTLTVKRPK